MNNFTESKHIGIARIREEARLRYNPLRNLTPQRITQAMDNFHCGYLSDAAKIYDAIRRRDAIVQACVQKRKRATFRDANKDTLNAHAQGKQTAGERKTSNDARSWVAKNSATARRVSGAPQGVAETAKSAQGNSATEQAKNTTAKSKQATPATADAALGQELQKRGTDGDKGGDPKKDTDNIEKMTKALNDCLEALKDIKNNTAATATKKENK